ncbi:2-C-methyl-D-erythritol 4-phosphate cytidylyltransferase [Clostridium aminobutyricum]|uniref:Bifunctional enzyme IspD/IspF n=1 Tax=Clostridium aminobutyricum TaxID=33953 RepID=A0A939DAU8_CLOAM|nr:2-C-methyl-D-erythritol 4-phosphate cytidylyltransferase [Clostridium aminobutyricum]MBN7774422.1 2-C-methyl-D-erythritol 2,4-cyclodiphosphate synthase [Clostridium aminobutyricum]
MYKTKKIAVIIAAAGSGKRMGSGIPKQFLKIEGLPVFIKTVDAFCRHPYIDGIFVVVSKEYLKATKEILCKHNLAKIQTVVEGGSERQDSVYNALQALPADVDYVIVHDAARPFVSDALINRTVEEMVVRGAVVAAVPVKDTIKIGDHEKRCFKETLKRDELYAVQTPQGFERKLLMDAYEKAYTDHYCGTDDAVLVERIGQAVYIVEGEYNNLKITTKEDLPMEMRIGSGYDVHRFSENRDLILGGVKIPYTVGLLGHSDADVLTHAIMDALLGAAALGDIGKHFPDTDPAYKGISSLKLLSHVGQLLAENGFQIGNIDATVIAQEPKLAAYIEQMKNNIAERLNISHNIVNVKATTTEKLGFTGRKEGIASEAVCLLKTNNFKLKEI